MDFVTLPTTSHFTDWSKHCHVTFIEITSFNAIMASHVPCIIPSKPN